MQFYSVELTQKAIIHMCDDDWVKRVTVQLDDELHKAAKHYAVEQECSMNDLFVDAIRKYLEDEREKMYGDKP